MLYSEEINQEIKEATLKHWHYATERFGKEHILGIFPYGSINYGLYIPGKSDVDTKAIYIPSIEEAIFDKPISKELHLRNKNLEIEHCEVKDIRLMIDNYKKANINFLETMFTDFYIINPNYSFIWNPYFLNNKEEYVKAMQAQMKRAVAGQALHTANYIDEFNWDGKRISNIYRLGFTIFTYDQTQNFKKAIELDPAIRKILLNLKTSKEQPKDFKYEELYELKKYLKNLLNKGFEWSEDLKNLASSIEKDFYNGALKAIKEVK